MSFGLPSVKNKPAYESDTNINVGGYGVPNVMIHGFASVKNNLEITHPLIQSEKNFAKNRENLTMTMLRNAQGLHAPLKFAMECQAARKVGRLPFLTSSNIMLDVLTGRDIEIGPEDVFNTSEFREVSGQAHAVMEKSLGIL